MTKMIILREQKSLLLSPVKVEAELKLSDDPYTCSLDSYS